MLPIAVFGWNDKTDRPIEFHRENFDGSGQLELKTLCFFVFQLLGAGTWATPVRRG